MKPAAGRVLRRSAAILACLATAFHAAAEVPASPAPPPSALVHADDYTFGFYPQGWRRPGEGGPIRFAVQTNRYALLLDGTRGCVAHMGPVVTPMRADEAVMQDNGLLSGLPRVDLTFAVTSSGRTFPVVAGAGASEHLRLFRVGKYLQHFDVQTLQIGGLHSGAGLEGVQAWMEGYCWSDRLSLAFHVASHAHHLSAGHRLDSVGLSCSLQVPREYPIVESLREDGSWAPAEVGEVAGRAVAMRNDQGHGIALVAVPGAAQRFQLSGDGSISVEGETAPLAPGTVRSLTCVAIPSSDVRGAARREADAMASARELRVTVAAQGRAPYGDELKVEYDPSTGWHHVLLGESPDPNTLERVGLRLSNSDGEPRTVRLNLAKIGGQFSITGMSPVLRDRAGRPTGLPVQISKNWHVVPPWFSGLCMIEIGSQEVLELEFDLAYQNWGGVPAVSHAQLCLVGYGGFQLWDQMAIGSTGESICYDPDVNLGRSLIDDMRPLMVWGMGPIPQRKWSWTHNVGGADFLTLFQGGVPKRQFLRRQKTLYSSYGPVLSDVTYGGETPDGAIQSRVRARSWRSDDYVRALYTLRYDVVKPVAGIDRLAFFQLGADRYNWVAFRSLARGTAEGFEEAWEPPMGGEVYSRRGAPLPGRLPWIAVLGVHQAPAASASENEHGALADKALMVRTWSARLDGRDCPEPYYSVFSHTDPTSKGAPGHPEGIPTAVVELSPPQDVQALQPGDFVDTQVEVLILPQSADDYYGPNAGLAEALRSMRHPWDLVVREAAGSDLEVVATVGRVEGTFPVQVRADAQGNADFAIRGGVGYTPVAIAGLASPGPFVLSRIAEDGSAMPIDQSSPVGNDWWQTRYDAVAGEYTLVFTLPLDTYGPVTRIRFTAGPAAV